MLSVNIFAGGSLYSRHSREPQRIVMEELNGDYFFYFCPNKNHELETCQVMGRSEGYREDELQASLDKIKQTKEVQKYFAPITKMAPIVAGVMAIPVLGPSGAFFIGSLSSYMAHQANRDPRNDAQFWINLSHGISPNLAKNFNIPIQHGRSIVNFSYHLEDILWKIDHCKDTKRRGVRCKGRRPSIGNKIF